MDLRRSPLLSAIFALTLVASAACYSDSDESGAGSPSPSSSADAADREDDGATDPDPTDPGPTDPDTTDAGTTDAGPKPKEDAGPKEDASAGDPGLPCDVAALLAARCQGCHKPGGNGPMPLLTYADLVAPSPSDPSKSNAVAVIGRMRSSSKPMPPGKIEKATEAEIQSVEKWVAAGTPGDGCDGDN